MKSTSVKHKRIKSNLDDEQDSFDSLLKIKRLEYQPGPTGTKVHLSLARTKIVRGGLGSGKSRCATEHINSLALRYPGSRYVIARKDLTSLKETTQKEFLEQAVDSETVESFNVNDNKLSYKNGSEILFRETKDPDKFKSLELTGFLIDEADENGTPEAYEKLDERLRQKIMVDGNVVMPPFCGLLVFNPTDDQHWLHGVAHRRDIDVEDFRFDTYENIRNLPPDYIPTLIKRLPAWDVNRLIHGHWGRRVIGKPVLHGFTRDKHVKPLKVNPWYPVLRGWDFGYNHPAVAWMQIDPMTKRLFILREFLGDQIKLQDDPLTGTKGVASIVKETTSSLVGLGHPVFDYGDPHGEDQKDVGQSSIEYLRIHHSIHVMSKRERIKTGLDELQERIINEAKIDDENGEPSAAMYPCLLVDPSCINIIAALEGGYARDNEGNPAKDGFYDHLMDVIRYVLVHNMGGGVRLGSKKRYKPRNIYTGY